MRGFQAASDGITIPFLVLFLWSKIIRKSGHQLQSPITICYWIFPRSSICYRQLEQMYIYIRTVSFLKLRTLKILHCNPVQGQYRAITDLGEQTTLIYQALICFILLHSQLVPLYYLIQPLCF